VHVVLFDTLLNRKNLLPLSFTRSVADMRVGVLTIKEKWEKYLEQSVCILTEPYLQAKYEQAIPIGECIFIHSAVIPNAVLLVEIDNLSVNESLWSSEKLIAFKTDKPQLNFDNLEAIACSFQKKQSLSAVSFLERPYYIFKLNATEIEQDFHLLTKGRVSQPLSTTNTLIGSGAKLLIEEQAVVEASVQSKNRVHIYIGKKAEIMEGCVVRGPLALCEDAGLKMAAKIYGATTIGPHCKVGGEVNNSVFFAYSNKGHDGFIGNSVIGEWCNLGADTNNSNLKNNYSNVDVWNYSSEKYEDTGLQFHGLIMGDHAKCGINTMFNTGAVVGVSANVFGSDFPPKFIPSFSWGGAQWLRTFTFEKSLEVAEKMMERRGIKLSETEISILKEVFERDKKFRKS